jgi:PAS domain S-box-containing protein
MPERERVPVKIVHRRYRGRLGKENARFHSWLLDTIGHAIIVIDLQERVIYCNNAAAQLYGWSKEEAKGQRLEELAVCEALWTQAKEIRAQLRSGRACSWKFVVQRKDGVTITLMGTVQHRCSTRKAPSRHSRSLDGWG